MKHEEEKVIWVTNKQSMDVDEFIKAKIDDYY
jgi:hypothetical protein